MRVYSFVDGVLLDVGASAHLCDRLASSTTDAPLGNSQHRRGGTKLHEGKQIKKIKAINICFLPKSVRITESGSSPVDILRKMSTFRNRRFNFTEVK